MLYWLQAKQKLGLGAVTLEEPAAVRAGGHAAAAAKSKDEAIRADARKVRAQSHKRLMQDFIVHEEVQDFIIGHNDVALVLTAAYAQNTCAN
jgi:intergrase/recombinase